MSTVRTGRASEAVIGQLEELISSGRWPVGTRIPPEPELVAALGVGRNTVREAVRALEHVGLLDPRRGDGTYVKSSSALTAVVHRRAHQGESIHVVELNAAVERAAVVAAARHRTSGDLTRMDDAATRQRFASSIVDLDTFGAADAEFHHAVVAASGNPMLVDVHSGLFQACPGTACSAVRPQEMRRFLRSHSALLAAIRARDEQSAVAAADTYLALRTRRQL